MSKIKTGQVENFPTTKRNSVNKLMTENSVTRIINRLIDSDGYVITTGLEDIDFSNDIPISAWDGHDFEFVIRGYYFSILNAEGYGSGLRYLRSATQFNYNFDSSDHTLYANIIIDNTDSNFPELYGQDDTEGEYNALIFSIDEEEINIPPADKPEDYTVYTIPVLKYLTSDNNYFVTLDCLHRFSSISIADIDGGEIIL